MVMSKDDKKESHESYGMIRFGRVSCSGAGSFFGSPLNDHLSCVRITIKKGVRWLSDDHELYQGNEAIVEVDLTHAQFSECLTAMNVGDGVPCTIRRLGKDGVSPPPRERTKAERVRSNFAAEIRDRVKKAEELAADARKLLSEKSLRKAEREELMSRLDRIATYLGANAEFFLQRFQEASEQVVVAAKSEVDAFVTTAAHTAGIDALKGGGPPLLGEGK